MRVIKFRGKCIETGAWVYGYFFRSSDGESCHIKCNDFGTTNYYEVEEKTVSQFTGLPDKNSKEIYEGDILKFKFEDGEPGYSQVVFQNGCFFDGDDCQLPLSETHEESEVVGNIYQNSELLK